MKLSALIKKERKKTSYLNLRDRLRRSLSTLYEPSWTSLSVAVLFGTVFFLLVHCIDIEYGDISFLDSNHYQNLIAVHAGIGMIIFALLIFIAESMRDDETKDRVRVLLRESHIWLLTIAEILVFLIFIWGDVNWLIVIPTLIIGLFTIYSMGSILQVMLSSYAFSRKRAQLLKERLQQSINLAIDERLGNNILLNGFIQKSIKLVYQSLCNDSQPGFHYFKTEKRGIITDIDLKQLEVFAEIIEEQAKLNGFSFEERLEDGAIDTTTDHDSVLASTASENRYKVHSSRFLRMKYREKVDDDNNTLVKVDEIILRNANIDKLNSYIKRAFTIKQSDDFNKHIRRELSGVRDQFIKAISENQLSEIEDLKELYTELASAFLEVVSSYGVTHSFEQAKMERNDLLGGWKEVKWLSSDIEELYHVAFRTGDLRTVRAIIFLPFSIAIKAIKYKDHYLFQEFMPFARILYHYSGQAKEKGLKELMIDRSWRYIKEIAQFHIEPKLIEKNPQVQDIIDLKNFAIWLLVVLHSLLTDAVQKSDLDNFPKLINAVIRLFDRFKPSASINSSDDLRWRLKNNGLSETDLKKINDRLLVQDALEKAEREINERRSQLLFGIASWILEKFTNNPDNKDLKELFYLIKNNLPSDLILLTRNFLDSHKFEVEDFWGWTWWDLEEEEVVHKIRNFERIEKLYVIISLEILEDKPDEQILEIDLPLDADLAGLIASSGQLMNSLNNIITQPSSWRFVLSDEAIKKANIFKELLHKTKIKEENARKSLKREKTISPNKVDNFMRNIISGHSDLRTVKEIFYSYDLYLDKTGYKYSGEIKRFGINRIDDKAAFFDDWHIDYVGWGNHYGSNIALGEDRTIFKEISDICNEIANTELNTILNDLNDLSNIIIIGSSLAILDFFNEESYQPKWDKDSPQLNTKGFDGWYLFKKHRIPIFEVHGRELEKKILILNKEKLGNFIQYSPLDEGDDETQLKGIFFMSIQSFSENSDIIEKFIEKPPKWLSDLGDEETQRNHLMEKVWIRIFERFEFKKHDDFEGYVINVK